MTRAAQQNSGRERQTATFIAGCGFPDACVSPVCRRINTAVSDRIGDDRRTAAPNK
jgi:hypothetical protein